jgi:protein tyrosine phosphatase (PTP) superfamily phosphohydrolase (DUF442 family)
MPSSISQFDISQITDILYVSAWPEKQHRDEIVSQDIRLILSMHWWKPNRVLAQPPLELMWLPTIDLPITPMPLDTLRRGVEAALPVIEAGGKVLAHCRAGRHRGVAMAACVLVGTGYSADDAIQLIKDKRSAADPDAWYIRDRILKFESYWRDITNS